jgi:hypothetical protein
MTTKKPTHGKLLRSPKGGFFLYHGLKIAKAGKPQSETARIIQEELLKRSETRGARKSA